ncbi:MAG: SDR family NAD(P)-dependent oxidoreductase [Gammaproteobacteria bacterium]|jgi:NAD(P)-dependent dehydrogenase (short-subunit alcohol dehydrogenase family)|nr:SDR family NAD(P)-dependent oxidoreductase [Gammaproteobacteria bacterium]
MKIKDCIALVSGGGSGLGEAVCRYLAELGAKIIVLDKDENAAVRVSTAVHGMAVQCDITQDQALEEAFVKIQQAHVRPISVAINCAGIAPAQRMVGRNGPVALSWFEEVIKINLIGSFNVMRLSAAQMMKAQVVAEEERGVIINTASIAAFDGQIGQIAYSASKGGVVGMTLPAARELAKFGIRVMAIAPGLFDTPMLQNMPQEVRAALHEQTLFPKRFGQPEEFASLVAQIITNPMFNGEVIRLDGGIRMHA